MRVLVTGAEGFVGTHLSRELLDHGHQVIPSDLRYADLSCPEQIENQIRGERPEYVVHLGARYGRILCRDAPHWAVCDNAAGTTELAAVCADLSIPVLYASSSEVYGDHGEDPITELSELRMPTTIYGLSKRWGEEALNLYLPPDLVCTVRMNMLYGPGQLGGYGRCALATFIDNAKRGEPIVAHHDTSRSWLYIADAARALRLLIEDGHHGIFNLGNDQERMAMTEVAALVADDAGVEVRVTDPPAHQIRHKVYDSTKLTRLLDWRPEVDLREGIRRTAQMVTT